MSRIRLNESNLRNIIKHSVNKVLNEATSTPDEKTLDAVDTIHYGRDIEKDWRSYEASDKIDQLGGQITKAIHCLQRLKDDCPPYFYEAIWKHLNQSCKMCERLGQKEIMNQGEQPDEYYNQRHLPRNKRKGYGQLGIFEP